MMVVDLDGWMGSFMVVLTYALNMYKKLDADSIPYYLLNLFGSAFMIVNTLYHQAIPSAVVNIIWVLIAIIALAKKKPA